MFTETSGILAYVTRVHLVPMLARAINLALCTCQTILIVHAQVRAYSTQRLVLPMLTLERRDALQTQNRSFAMFNASVILVKDNVTVNAIEKLMPMLTETKGTSPIMYPNGTLHLSVAPRFDAKQSQIPVFAIFQRQLLQLRITQIAKRS